MKKAGLALLVVLALGAGGVYLAFHYVDVIVRLALEHYGPEVLGAPVKVGEVRISPRDGRGTIRDLEIGNPPGFNAAHAARLGEIRVSLDPATITDRVVVIHELVLQAPRVTYERGAKATNLDAIQARIDAFAKQARADGGGAADSGPARRRFIIERLAIRGGEVVMTNAALKGQGLAFALPDIELRDVGRDRGGVTASEAAAIVASALQQKIAQKLLTNIDLLRRGGVEGAIDALKGLVK